MFWWGFLQIIFHDVLVSDVLTPNMLNCVLQRLLVLFHPLLASCSHDSQPSVLQGDIGGERVLQKKWTTFLKAQLLCSLPDDGFPFNIIQDMFVLTPSPEDWKNTVFYGVFTSQW